MNRWTPVAVGLLAIGTALPLAAQPDITLIANEASLEVGAGAGNAEPEEMCLFGANSILCWNDEPDAGETLVEIDLTDGTTTARVTQADLVAAMDAANGGDPAPTNITPQSVGIASDGDIIVTSDGGGGETGAVFSIDSGTFAVSVVSGATAASQASVEGINVGATVVGNNVYYWTEDGFGGTDDIYVVDTNDGAAPDAIGTVFCTEADILAVTGQSAGDPRISDMITNPDGDILAANSGSSSSNDDILRIFVTTGTPGSVEVYLAATDVEADLGITDVGYTVIDQRNDSLILGNFFGTGAEDDAFIQVDNISGGAGDASLLITEAQAVADPEIGGTSWFVSNNGTVVSGSLLIIGQTNGPESINAIDLTAIPVPVELSVFNAD